MSRVVACEPVPNAWPGSITTSSAPSSGGSHGGRTRSGAGTSTGLWKLRQSSPQPSGSSVVETSISAPADRRAHVADVGQLARRAVEHVLDRVAGLALLQPAGRERHQLGEDELRVLALDADRELDHGLQHQRRPAVELAPLHARESEQVGGRWPAQEAGGDQAVRGRSLARHAR